MEGAREGAISRPASEASAGGGGTRCHPGAGGERELSHSSAPVLASFKYCPLSVTINHLSVRQ